MIPHNKTRWNSVVNIDLFKYTIYIMGKRLFLICFLFSTLSLQAQVELTLDDCIRLGWKQNPEIKNSALRIKGARADYVASIGAFLPRGVIDVTTGRRYGRSIDPGTNGYTTESFDEGSIGLDMTLSLFEGFSRINRVRFEKMNYERTEWELKNRQNELAYQITDTYYKLLLERKLQYLAYEQSILGERYLRQTETFVELGLKSESDLQEVKARCEGDIYRYETRKNSARLILLHLKQLINVSACDTLIIKDTVNAEILPVLSVSSPQYIYDRSVEMLPSIKVIDLQQRAARKEYAMAGGQFSPSLYARFTIGSDYYNGFSSHQLKNNIGKYIGIGISFPLLSGLERLTRLRKQKLSIYQLQNNAEFEKQRLYTEVEQTVLSIHAGHNEHRQALSQLRAEEQVLKESERKWEEGLISVFQLMESRNRFISAKAELMRVRLQMEMLSRLEQYYRNGTFIAE